MTTPRSSSSTRDFSRFYSPLSAVDLDDVRFGRVFPSRYGTNSVSFNPFNPWDFGFNSKTNLTGKISAVQGWNVTNPWNIVNSIDYAPSDDLRFSIQHSFENGPDAKAKATLLRAGNLEFLTSVSAKNFFIPEFELGIVHGKDKQYKTTFPVGSLKSVLDKNPHLFWRHEHTVRGDDRDNYDLFGSAKKDLILGYFGNDWLVGYDGNDKLVGHAGADKLWGGAGADVFAYNRTSDSGTYSSTRDTIADFQPGVDRIDLRSIDADRGESWNQRFKFIGTRHFTGADAAVRYYTNGINSYVQVEIHNDGNIRADMEITVLGVTSLSASDFYL